MRKSSHLERQGECRGYQIVSSPILQYTVTEQKSDGSLLGRVPWKKRKEVSPDPPMLIYTPTVPQENAHLVLFTLRAIP